MNMSLTSKRWVMSTAVMLCIQWVLCLFIVLPVAKAEEWALNDNMMTNAGFEAGNTTDWLLNVTGSTYMDALTNAAHSGSYGLRTTLLNGVKDAHASQIFPVIEDASYRISAWVYGADIPDGTNARIKLEFFNNDEYLVAQTTNIVKSSMNGQWHQVVIDKQIPAGINKMQVYLRLQGDAGTVYFDDVSVSRTVEPPVIQVKPNELLYYPELTNGRIDARLLPADGVYSNKTVNLRIYRVSTNDDIVNVTGLAATENFSYSFNPSLMTELRETYRVKVMLMQGASEIASATADLYQWQRPTMLTQDGTLVVNGQPFFPIIGYHLQTRYAEAAPLVNTVQGATANNSNTTILNHLNMAQSQGLKVFFPLYTVDQSVITAKVNMFKDHSALLGWMLMDEPGVKYTRDQLLGAYKKVRELDDVHPVYITEYYSFKYADSADAADIFAVDKYPLLDGDTSDINEVGDRVLLGQAAVDHHKPVYSIVNIGEPNRYVPTIEEHRHMVYQSVLDGAKGIGYYALNEDDWHLADQPGTLFADLASFKTELTQIGALVTSGVKTGGTKGDIQWGLYEKDSERYLLAINRTHSPQSTYVTLPVSGYSAVPVAGTGGVISGQGSTLALSLAPLESVFNKLNPENLAYNPGFEIPLNSTAPDGWGMRFLAEWASDEVHGGQKSMKINPYSDVNNAVSTRPAHRVVVEPGVSYKLKAWVKTTSTVGGAYIGIREVKTDASTLKYNYTQAVFPADWTQYEITVTPQAEAAKLEIYLKLDKDADGPAWFDDVVWEKIQP